MKKLMAPILYAVALLFYSCLTSFADKVAQDSMGGSQSSKEGPPERPYYLTGDSRVVAGVHYASDTEAGLALGDLLFTEIEAQPRFQKDMDAAVAKDQLPGK